MEQIRHIYDLSYSELENYLKAINDKAFRAKQIYQWLYDKKVNSFNEMSNLSKGLQANFDNNFKFNKPIIVKRQIANDGTRKYLLDFNGDLVETVLMRYNYGNSVCVSSQVGCNMGCQFCASGLLKKKRDLTIGEMVSQIMIVNEDLKEEEKTVTHVVVMGTGEPFDNYDNLVSFLQIINNPFGLAIGARHITVSTCGIIPKINKFSNLGLQVNLAISLHASNDELRNELMPINKVYPLIDLIKALKDYIKKTNRRVTIEYLMLKDVNDSLNNARELVELLRGMNVYVNLIPYNNVEEKGYQKSNQKTVDAFFDQLQKRRINTTVRKEFGSDIDAACGQLRAKTSFENK